MAIKLLIVSGTTHADGRVLALALRARSLAESLGADARLLDLAEIDLPLFSAAGVDPQAESAVQLVRESAAAADAFLLGTPEYHGGMSGALKNWFDFLYEELAGKLAAVYSVAGGMGGDMSVTAVKTSFQWCHGFTLPFHVSAGREDFDGSSLSSAAVGERLQRIVHDLLHYAPPLAQAYRSAQSAGDGPASGFAGLHLP